MNIHPRLHHLNTTAAATVLLLSHGLAAAQATPATSSVTLFGLLDANMSRYSPGSHAGGGVQNVINDGVVNGLNGSRWGIRVAEDLGGGLKASVLLESGLNADTGTLGQGGRAFGRQAFIALSAANAGELRLGRQYILSDSVVGQGNPFANALVNNPTTAVTNMGKALPMWFNAPRADNVVQYQTPNWAGFTAAGQIAPGEGTADRFHGLRAVYSSGVFYTGLTYEWNKSRTTGENTNKSLSFTANYNFGFMKLEGGLQRNTDLATGSVNGAASGVTNLLVTGDSTFTAHEIDGWTIGAEVPVSTALVFGLNFTRMKYEAASGGANADLGKLALTARYGLSKNTFLYAGGSIATGELKEYISQKQVLQAGLRMAF